MYQVAVPISPERTPQPPRVEPTRASHARRCLSPNHRPARDHEQKGDARHYTQIGAGSEGKARRPDRRADIRKGREPRGLLTIAPSACRTGAIGGFRETSPVGSSVSKGLSDLEATGQRFIGVSALVKCCLEDSAEWLYTLP